MKPLPLTKTNRLKLAYAFRNHSRFDTGIDCAVEGQMGHAFADNADDPTVFLIEQGGFFAYLAGDAQSAAGRATLEFSAIFPDRPPFLAFYALSWNNRLHPLPPSSTYHLNRST